ARRMGFSLAVLIMGWHAAPMAAGVCDAPFMHDNGRVRLDGTGALRLGANLTFAEVKKSGDGQCSARVRGTATFGLAGLPAGKSDLDYWMTMRNGEASFEREAEGGGREPVEGKFDLRMLGLFSYGEPISRAG